MSTHGVPPRRTAAEREQEALEAALRRRRLSVRLGSAGVFLLFLGGLGVYLSWWDIALLLGVMVIGIVLVLAAFLLVANLVRDLTKIT